MNEHEERRFVEGMRQLARATRAHYEELIAQGFSKEEAFELTKAVTGDRGRGKTE